MRRVSLLLGLAGCIAALLFFARSPTELAKPAKEVGGQPAESTALRPDSQRPELVEASAILRIEMSSNMATSDLATSLAALLERPQLDEISARLALETRWSLDADQTAQKLAKILSVTPTKDGKDGIVRASDSSPVMAASLANAAASVLRDHLERNAKTTAQLERNIKGQQDLVEDRRKLLASIIRSGMIIHQSEKGNPAGSTPPAPPVVRPDGDGAVYVDAKGEFERATQELSRMETQRRDLKEITIHHILWAEAKEKE